MLNVLAPIAESIFDFQHMTLLKLILIVFIMIILYNNICNLYINSLTINTAIVIECYREVLVVNLQNGNVNKRFYYSSVIVM